MSLKRFIQVLLLLWFVVINAAILIPSYRMLFGADAGPATSPLPAPTPPPPPALGPLDPALGAESQKQQVETYKQQAASYAEQVKSYTQQVAAYKVQTEVQNKSGRAGVYEMVVKNTLVSLLGGFATTLIGVVFANLGAGVVDNFVRMRNGSPPQRLTLL